MTTDFVTCKLIFSLGIIKDEEQLNELLKKYTDDFSIANFYPEKEIGCNKTTVAIIDVPQKIVTLLLKEKIVKEIDLMSSFSARSTKDCSDGGCGCPPKG